MERKLHHLALGARDIDRVAAFYRDLLGLREVKRLTHSRVTMLDGTHLFPLEQPQATASAVLHWLASFGAARPSHDAA